MSEPSARLSPADHRPQRVLLVEDDPAVRDATRMLLSMEGYTVTAVSSLEEAIDALPAGVDLLITDYHLPDGHTGIQVIKALRGALGRPLKAVLITADTSRAIRELPDDPHLKVASKPLKAEEMLTLMDTLA